MKYLQNFCLTTKMWSENILSMVKQHNFSSLLTGKSCKAAAFKIGTYLIINNELQILPVMLIYRYLGVSKVSLLLCKQLL
jgi:hypothetical protein